MNSLTVDPATADPVILGELLSAGDWGTVPENVGGAGGWACATARSANTNPAPQSGSGFPGTVQSIVLVGLVMIVVRSSTVIAGSADLTSVATPAALGVAALVPKKGAKPGTVVLTPSAPASCGFCNTSGVLNRVPLTSNRRVFSPRELNGSGSLFPFSFAAIAATASEPRADAASG